MNTASDHAGNLESAVLGGGCFWCLEAVFQRQKGVASATSGYAGGTTREPTYKEVCGGGTGHAEVIQVQFDPRAVSYSELLDLFWRAHDPTTRDRQGADVGPQYRSIILFSSEKQAEEAARSKESAQENFSSVIVTEIAPLSEFWPAEKDHHNFYNRNRGHPYCLFNIVPKLEKLGL